MPIYMLSDNVYDFPPIAQATDDGLLAIGGDLSTERMLIAYSSGIFPWYSEGEPILWWSPEQRMVMKPNEMKITQTLQKTLDSNKFSCSMDAGFGEVIKKCAEADQGKGGIRCITEDLIASYKDIYNIGFAHSVEVYEGNKMMGGLYGMAIGKIFCLEAMFQTKTNASKTAFYHLAQFLKANDFELIDMQQGSQLMKTMGAHFIPRKDFLKDLKVLTKNLSLVGNWGNGEAKLKELVIEI